MQVFNFKGCLTDAYKNQSLLILTNWDPIYAVKGVRESKHVFPYPPFFTNAKMPGFYKVISSQRRASKMSRNTDYMQHV